MRVILRENIKVKVYRTGGPEEGETKVFSKGLTGICIDKMVWRSHQDGQKRVAYRVIFDNYKKDTEMMVDAKCIEILDEGINDKNAKINKHKGIT